MAAPPRRAPQRPALVPVLRALIDSKYSAKFEQCLRHVAKDSLVRLYPFGASLFGDYKSAGVCQWDSELTSNRSTDGLWPSAEEQEAFQRALDAGAPEVIERLASRGLWPMEWLDGAGPTFAHKRMTFAEVINIASMIPVINAATSACFEALRETEWRNALSRPVLLQGMRNVSSDGAVPEFRGEQDGGAIAQQLLLYPVADRFGVRASITRKIKAGGGHQLRLDVPVLWGQRGNLSEELRFSRWLEESGGVLEQLELIAV